MAERPNTAKTEDTTAGRRDEATETQTETSNTTGAGQEAARGNVPEKHDREHQSNYGGGGTHGGAKGQK
jgi:hypothetical protein